MANLNVTTQPQSPPILGMELAIPEDKVHEISIILRVILALDTNCKTSLLSDLSTLVDEGEPYENLQRHIIWCQRSLVWYQKNISDIANRIYEVLNNENN